MPNTAAHKLPAINVPADFYQATSMQLGDLNAALREHQTDTLPKRANESGRLITIDWPTYPRQRITSITVIHLIPTQFVSMKQSSVISLREISPCDPFSLSSSLFNDLLSNNTAT